MIALKIHITFLKNKKTRNNFNSLDFYSKRNKRDCKWIKPKYTLTIKLKIDSEHINKFIQLGKRYEFNIVTNNTLQTF